MGELIVNLTRHPATPEQAAAGVVDLRGGEREELLRLLRFDALPDYDEVRERAEAIADLAVFNGLGAGAPDPLPSAAMVGGAAFLMAPLEAALRERGIEPVYSFSPQHAAGADGEGVLRPRHHGFVRTGR